jgi:hypothetical protein
MRVLSVLRGPHDERALRRAVAITLRRMAEHRAKPCPHAGFSRGPCSWWAEEQDALILLWRMLRDLGVEDPEGIRA